MYYDVAKNNKDSTVLEVRVFSNFLESKRNEIQNTQVIVRQSMQKKGWTYKGFKRNIDI